MLEEEKVKLNCGCIYARFSEGDELSTPIGSVGPNYTTTLFITIIITCTHFLGVFSKFQIQDNLMKHTLDARLKLKISLETDRGIPKECILI